MTIGAVLQALLNEVNTGNPLPEEFLNNIFSTLIDMGQTEVRLLPVQEPRFQRFFQFIHDRLGTLHQNAPEGLGSINELLFELEPLLLFEYARGVRIRLADTGEYFYPAQVRATALQILDFLSNSQDF